MIAKQSIGSSFMGALNYNLKKMYAKDPSQKAELLDTNFVRLDQHLIKKEVGIMKELNPRLKRNTYHTSLNFSKDEKISNQKMMEVAQEYMSKMGFDNNGYFIFRHNDSSHPHCHILCLRNRYDGTVVSDSNNFARSEKIVRELENAYGLIQVEPSIKAILKAPNKDELEMVIRTGKASNKMLMQEKVDQELNRSHTIKELIQNLERKGIHLLFNQASTGRVSGITFLSEDFKAKGQALGNQFKWSSIQKSINYEQTRDSETISKTNNRTRSIFGESATSKLSGLSNSDNEAARIFEGSENFDSESQKSPEHSSGDNQNSKQGFSNDYESIAGNVQESKTEQADSYSYLSNHSNPLADLGDMLGNISASGNLEKDRKKKKKKKGKEEDLGLGR
ncbi:relaxase/mobilization nuclease domain-containing protein [Algoriphagus aquimarinus]|uniref:relaxase/mobilization nuclease domain-containing protein n=1 Tax=Algoriphagus aquimarinus TaxID=237018 RepID=UPI0030DB6695|tara:strand:+ start:116712 stop:117890 length:1179 start_codon:yes stop_codon:yes gene_type:complete